MAVNRDLKPMVDSSQIRTSYVPVIRILATSIKMQQSSKISSKQTSRTSSKSTSHRTNRGQWRYRSSHVHWDANIQSHGALLQAVRISKQWYPRWGRTQWISFGLPNVASKKVGSNMSRLIAGHPYVNVANLLLTTIWFVQLKEYRWWM